MYQWMVCRNGMKWTAFCEDETCTVRWWAFQTNTVSTHEHNPLELEGISEEMTPHSAQKLPGTCEFCYTKDMALSTLYTYSNCKKRWLCHPFPEHPKQDQNHSRDKLPTSNGQRSGWKQTRFVYCTIYSKTCLTIFQLQYSKPFLKRQQIALQYVVWKFVRVCLSNAYTTTVFSREWHLYNRNDTPNVTSKPVNHCYIASALYVLLLFHGVQHLC